jgi:hypothetical protein
LLYRKTSITVMNIWQDFKAPVTNWPRLDYRRMPFTLNSNLNWLINDDLPLLLDASNCLYPPPSTLPCT